MEFQDVARKRKMVRSFESTPIPKDVLDRILRNARRAPSAGFSQGWGFLVLEGAAETKRYWDLWPDRESWRWPDLFNAPALVFCLSNKETYMARYAEADKGWTDKDEKRWPVPYWHIDTGMAAMLILLSAVNEGLGALFFGIFDQERFRETFDVPAEYTAIGAIALGYPKAQDRPSPSLRRGHRPTKEVVRRSRWS